MKRNFLVGSVALAFVGISSAAAEDAPLIPDCYSANYSQSDFHDCVRRAGGASIREPAGQSSTDQSQQLSANAGYSKGAMDPDALPPPDGMREREHRRMADDAARDMYAGPPGASQEAEDGPPSYSDVDGSRSDEDGPQWGPPPDIYEPDADGPPSFGPPPASEDWRASHPYQSGPPDDGPDADL